MRTSHIFNFYYHYSHTMDDLVSMQLKATQITNKQTQHNKYHVTDHAHFPRHPCLKCQHFSLIQALVCGGSVTLRSCLVFEQEDNAWQWRAHSTLREDRYFHSVVVMPAGTYILGGYSNRYTTEFLPTGSSAWQAGPAIPSPGLAYGCAVAIDSTRFVVTGGKVFSPTDCVANVRVYDTASDTWIQFGINIEFGQKWHDYQSLIFNFCHLTGLFEAYPCGL